MNSIYAEQILLNIAAKNVGKAALLNIFVLIAGRYLLGYCLVALVPCDLSVGVCLVVYRDRACCHCACAGRLFKFFFFDDCIRRQAFLTLMAAHEVACLAVKDYPGQVAKFMQGFFKPLQLLVCNRSWIIFRRFQVADFQNPLLFLCLTSRWTGQASQFVVKF